MNFTIEKYCFPMRDMDWWWIELDEGIFSPHQFGERPIKQAHEWFTEEEATQVEGMTLFSGGDIAKHKVSIYRRFADLSKFINLKYLNVPLDAIGCIDLRSVASNLQYLCISTPRADSFRGYYEKTSHPNIFEENLPNLKTLQLLCSPILFKNFDAERYPSLEWLDCPLDFDKSGKLFKFFKNSPSMQGYSLEVISKKDLLKNIPKNITALRFWSITTRQFDFSLFSEFRDLKYLEIAGCFTSIDCTVFADLPNLLELNITTSEAVKNTAMLLKSNSLEKVGLVSNDSCDLLDGSKQRMSEKFKEFYA